MKILKYKEYINEQVKKQNGEILLKEILKDIKYSCENEWFDDIESSELESDNYSIYVNEDNTMWHFIFSENDIIGSEALTKYIKLSIKVYDKDTTEMLIEKSPISILIGDLKLKRIKELMRIIRNKFNTRTNDLTDNVYKN